MIFKIFTAIVFIAELIIAISAIMYLLKLNKKILVYNDIIADAKPKIKEIFVLIKGLSEQILELIPEYIENMKRKFEDKLFAKLQVLLTSLLVWKLNIKLIRKIRKSFIFKTALKSFSLIRNMV